ncbi:MAG: hypothetical protein DWQ44_03555 [Bacteroidetes bacterium]|nr:MAG: hypothetical protein DWQ33_04245 [Bacteroidota bacterium]REJ99932.1 MAG: hypothetical protein DWQ39_13520 [Bacteroidota bacterium]REK35888.1 MAG: hypothetical protein DWQ44_03555 [Bacteroidota bacterium]REK50635.1 MAG: hypothetical protein DWQ48_04810 [Bacteroidota bacterium]
MSCINSKHLIKFAPAFLAIFIFAFSCKNSSDLKNTQSSQSDLAFLSWMSGTWENSQKEVLMREEWTLQGDSLMTGTGMQVKGNDTLFIEQLRIFKDAGEVYYVATVEGQNDNQPVFFRMSASTEKSAVFENPQHDFPQVIRYELESPNVLLATIEAVKDSKKVSREFRFRKATVRLMP